MSELNRLRGQLANAYARAGGLDDLNAIPTMAPEIFPVLSIYERVELWALQEGKIGSIRQSQAAGGAGTNGFLQLHNRSTSGMIAILERLYIATAILIRWNITPDSGIVAAVDPFVNDSRNAVGNDENLGLGLIPDAATTGGVADGTTATGAFTGINWCPLDIVLTPGWRVIFSAPANTAWDITVSWRERPAQQVELRLG